MNTLAEAASPLSGGPVNVNYANGLKLMWCWFMDGDALHVASLWFLITDEDMYRVWLDSLGILYMNVAL